MAVRVGGDDLPAHFTGYNAGRLTLDDGGWRPRRESRKRGNVRMPSSPTSYYSSGTFGIQPERLQCLLNYHPIVRPLRRLRNSTAVLMARLLAVVSPPRRKVERLCAAIRTGSVQDVAACLQPGVRLSVPGKHGLPPLHMAALATKDSAATALLLDAGADIEARAYEGSTPLIAAAANNRHPAVVVGLLDRGADIDARQDCPCHRGWTALHMAAWANQNPAVTTALIDAGADIDTRTPRYAFTALHCASASSVRLAHHVHIAALISRGADVQARDDGGFTALHYAVIQDNPAVMSVLIEAGADLEAATWETGLRPLHLAAASGRAAPLIAALLDAGADTSARTKARAAHSIIAIGRTLQQRGAALPWGGAVPLRRRVTGAELMELEVTPLRVALWCRNLDAIAALLNAGTDVEREDWALLQALDDAELIVALLGIGVDVMKFPLRPPATDKPLGTALHFAAAFGRGPRPITALVDAGCDVNSRDAQGETPLLSAVAYNPAPRLVVPALLGAGADIEATRGNNLTALHVAIIRLPSLLTKNFRARVNSGHGLLAACGHFSRCTTTSTCGGTIPTGIPCTIQPRCRC